jgi:hypothetical protein
MTRARTPLLFPRGTCKTPRLFSGDGDQFTDSEPPSDDTPARSELADAKLELAAARSDFEQVQNNLNDKSTLALSIANSIGHNSSSSPEHADLRRRIAELTVEIEETEHKIEEARSSIDPALIVAREKERNEYFRQVETLDRELAETQQRIRQRQFDLFRLLSSDDWEKATAAAAERQIMSRIHDRLRSILDNATKEHNSGTTGSPVKSVPPAIQALLDERARLERECRQAEQQRWCAQTSRRVNIASRLDNAKLLDAALRALNAVGLDVPGLSKEYLPDGPLTPLKPRAKTPTGVRAKQQGLADVETGRSKSDLKRPIRGRRGG